MKRITRVLSALVIGGIMLTGCNQPAAEGNAAAPETEAATENATPQGQAMVAVGEGETANILQIALGSPDHTTLVAAVQAVQMENVLANNGPLTVFAPTNAAFEALPAGTVETLLKPENKSTLQNIITFHAAPGKYGPDNIKGVMGIGQATGDKVNVEVKDGVTYVNGAKVLASVEAGNGYVHVIDAVLLPPEK